MTESRTQYLRRQIGISLAFVTMIRQWLAGDHDAARVQLREVAVKFGPSAVVSCATVLSRQCAELGIEPDPRPAGFSDNALDASGFYVRTFMDSDKQASVDTVARDFAMVLGGDPLLAEEIFEALFARMQVKIDEQGVDEIESHLCRMEANTVRLGQSLPPD